MNDTQGIRNGGFVRLTTEDTELLLPALAQAGGAFRLSARNRLDVHGLEADEVAFLAALHNAVVSDLEMMPSGATGTGTRAA
jgi:hypothetical protein